MDVKNNEGSRDTRARTRRMSMYVCPSNPVPDAVTERASPRPMRKTYLNTATPELKTPARSTRLSVARGETPEPVSAKRATRTRAKMVRKQLTLKGDANEDLHVGQAKMGVQLNENNSLEEKHLHTKQYKKLKISTPKPMPVAEQQGLNEVIPFADKTKSLHKLQIKLKKMRSERSSEITKFGQQQKSNSNNKGRPNGEQNYTGTVLNVNQLDEFSSTTQEKANTSEVVETLFVKDFDVIKTKPESLSLSTKKRQSKGKENQSPVVNDESNVSTSQLEETFTIIGETKNTIKDPDQSIIDSRNETNSYGKEQHEVPSFSSLKIQIKNNGNLDESDTFNASSAKIKLSNNDEGPLLTREAAKLKRAVLFEQGNMSPAPRLNASKKTQFEILTQITMPHPELQKQVVLNSNNKTDDLPKQTFPKTPSRVHTPQIELYCLSTDSKPETPMKPRTRQGRISSTPLADATSVSGQPPAQIDAIKPLVELEVKTTVKTIEDKLARRLVSEAEEVDEALNEKNEILEAGESLGNQDTIDEDSEKSIDKNMSCIVSDSDADHTEPLADISFRSDAKEQKKRKRIIVHDTTDDEDVDNKENEEDNNFEIKAKEHQSKKERDSSQEGKGSEVEEVFSSSHEMQQDQSVQYTKSILVASDTEYNPTKKSQDVLQNTELARRKSLSKAVEGIDLSKEEFTSCEDLIKSFSNDTPFKNDKPDHGEKRIISISEPLNKSLPFQEQERSGITVLVTEPSTSDLSTGNSSDKKRESLENPMVGEKSISQSILFHNKQTRKEEEELLNELESVGLSHLKQMFNPLQKSRRQTLFIQDSESSMHEYKKLKRPSDILSSDVQPTQSIIETLAEQNLAKSKRKRFSKSFSGASDALDASAIDEMQRNKAKKVVPLPKEQSNLPNGRDFYMENCDSILQSAKKTKLQQKKLKKASASVTPLTYVAKVEGAPVVAARLNEVSDQPDKLKKNLKRLKATKQRVKHDVHLLLPDTGPRLLSRKLSPHPEIADTGKPKQTTKPKIKHVPRVKNSVKKNPHVVDNKVVGFVGVSNVEDPIEVEIIRTSSGPFKVEPCTSKQKHFRKTPSTPGFQELANSPKTSKHNMAAATKGTESTFRSKKHLLGRRDN